MPPQDPELQHPTESTTAATPTATPTATTTTSTASEKDSQEATTSTFTSVPMAALPTGLPASYNFPPPPEDSKPPLHLRLLRFLVSRKLRNDLKGVLCFALAFAWIFYDETNQKFQARALLNMVIAVLVQHPAQPLGRFVDSAIINAAGLAFACAAWAFVNTAADQSYVWMGVLSFICVYFFAIFRAISARFFGFGLLGPLLTYTAVASVKGATGKNTANGDAFDRSFLRDTIYLFLIGFSISVGTTLLLWPEFSERHLIHELERTFSTLEKMVMGLAKAFSPEETNPDTEAEDAKHRAVLLKQLDGQIRTLWLHLEDTKSEPRVSRLSIADLETLVQTASSMTMQVSSIDKALRGADENEASVATTARFRLKAGPYVDHVKTIAVGCRQLLEYLRSSVRSPKNAPAMSDLESGAKDKGGSVEAGHVTYDHVMEAVRDLERAQLDILFDMLSKTGKEASVAGWDSTSGLVPHEALLQTNAFIFGFRKIATDLQRCLQDFISTPHPLRFRFSLSRYFPGRRATGLGPVNFLGERVKTVPWVRQQLSKLVGLLLRRESIYGIKCATAVVIYEVILFNQFSWYMQWYLQASFLTFLVAVGTSAGQTVLTFVINLSGAIIGYSYAFLALNAFGVGTNALTKKCNSWWGCDNGASYQWGLWASTVLFAIPMVHVQYNSKLSVLGLLSLLSFSTSLLGSYSNRQNPFYDDYWHRYYKLLASAAMAISFALCFTLLVYPNLARQRLRLSISSILRRLNALYTQVLATAYAPTSAHLARTASPTDAARSLQEIQALHLQLYRDLLGLDELLVYSSVEFRLSGPFPWSTYRAIVDGMKGVHEILGTGIFVVGEEPFDPFVRKLLASSLRKSKKDLQTVIRLLLFVYSSTMLAKQPLPNDLPSASHTRNLLFNHFWQTLADAVHAADAAEAQPEPQPPSPTPAVAKKDSGSHLSPRGVGTVADDASEHWEGSTLGVHEVGVLPTDPAVLRALIRSESWLRFYSFGMSVKMLSIQVDALGTPFKDLYGELPGFTLPAIATGAERMEERGIGRRSMSGAMAVRGAGRRGKEIENEMYDLEDRAEVERVEGIPERGHEAEEVKIVVQKP
ncbi:hypothetical protein HDU96_000706 [Phlyctochytrium bullatum]|nr:hypothetical protein HDU96_000706 [Phlyctochytrium bullatum]